MNYFQLNNIKRLLTGKIIRESEIRKVLDHVAINQKDLARILSKPEAQLIYNQLQLHGMTQKARIFKFNYKLASKQELRDEVKSGIKVNAPDKKDSRNYAGSTTLPSNWQEKRYQKAQREFYQRRAQQLSQGVPASFIKGAQKVGGYYYRGARFDELPIKYLIFLAEKNKVPHHLRKAFNTYYYSADTQKRVRDYLADRDTKPGGWEEVEGLRRRGRGYDGPVGPNVKQPLVNRRIYGESVNKPIPQNVADPRIKSGTEITDETEYGFSKRAGGDFAVSDSFDTARHLQDRYRGMPYEELISFDRIESRDRAEFQKVSGGWVKALPGFLRKSARETLEQWRQHTITLELTDLLEERRRMGQADPSQLRQPRATQDKLEFEELTKLGEGKDLRKFDVLGRIDQAKTKEELQEVIDDLDSSGLGVSLLWRQRLPNLVDYVRDKSNLLSART